MRKIIEKYGSIIILDASINTTSSGKKHLNIKRKINGKELSVRYAYCEEDSDCNKLFTDVLKHAEDELIKKAKDNNEAKRLEYTALIKLGFEDINKGLSNTLIVLGTVQGNDNEDYLFTYCISPDDIIKRIKFIEEKDVKYISKSDVYSFAAKYGLMNMVITYNPIFENEGKYML